MTDGSAYWGAQLPDPSEVVSLWPGAAPGADQLQLKLVVAERSTSPDFKDRAVTGIWSRSSPYFVRGGPMALPW